MRMFMLLFTCVPLLAAVAEQAMPLNMTRIDLLSVDAADGELANVSEAASVRGTLATAKQTGFISDFGEWRMGGYRTVVNVAGKHPYTFVMEDYPGLGKASFVERGFPLPEGSGLAGFRYDKGGDEILLKGEGGDPSALRILRTSATSAQNPPGLRVGGPAMVVEDGPGERRLVIPASTDAPSLRMLLVDDARDVPVTKWVDGGKTLRVEWHDQIDVFTFETDPGGRTKFVLERQRGEHQNEVIAFGMPYTPPERATGKLLAHWSFDRVQDGWVADMSGNRFHAQMKGGIRLTPGVVGDGVDGVSCEGVGAGELVLPTPEGVLPGELHYGEVKLPGEAFRAIRDKMTLTFWYAMPPTVGNAYHPYMGYWQKAAGPSPFSAKGIALYPYLHWLNGQRITAAALGNNRLFEMVGLEQPRDKWNHFALVIDGKEASLYLNGDLKMQKTGTTTLENVINTTETASLLKNIWARMDEVRLYDYPLSQDEIQQQFREDSLGLLSRLSFEEENVGVIQKGEIRDDAGNAYKAERVEIVARDEGKALRFLHGGGSVLFPGSITQGKHISAVTFSAWVKLPEGYTGRNYLLSSGNHGHVGMFVGFWGRNLWGTASQNGFSGSVTPGEWTHVTVSYGHNRIRTYINGENVQDNDEAFPSGHGWAVGRFSLGYEAGMEIDDVRLFSFALSDAQASDVFAGKDVRRPERLGGNNSTEKRVIATDFGPAQ